MKQISRYIMTLVALFAMTTGAWADGTWTSGGCTLKLEGTTLTVSKNTSGQMADYTYYYERGWNNDASSVTSLVIEEGVTYLGKSAFGMFTKITEVTIPSTVTSIGQYAIQQCYDLKTVIVKAASCTLGYRAFDLNSKMEHIYVPSDKVTDYKNAAGWSAYESIIEAAPVIPGDVTISTDKTSAEFDMPSYDATLEYDIVRNLASNMTLNLLIGGNAIEDNARLRIKKESGVYVPVSALTFTLADATEQTELTAQQALAAKLNPVFELKGEDDTWTVVENINAQTHLPENLAVGQTYRLTLVAAEDAPLYGGATLPSYTVTLFEGYEVQVAAQSFITYYKDEALTLDEEETAGELYTISSVTDEAAVLSSKIETAPANTPLLVYNNSNETKSILLIPTNEPNLALTVAPEFQGTLTARTFTADDMAAADHYMLTAQNQFVWVKDAGTIAANKCWLEIVNGSSNVRAIVFSDVATGIGNAKLNDITTGDWYDLNGRKLDKMPTRRGIYILNGKKVVVK